MRKVNNLLNTFISSSPIFWVNNTLKHRTRPKPITYMIDLQRNKIISLYAHILTEITNINKPLTYNNEKQYSQLIAYILIL